MPQISTKNILELGSILGVWAHPDDETFLAGGLMAKAVQNDQPVACVTFTKGEQGVYNEAKWPAASIANTRTKELKAALDILGVKEHTSFDYPDGYCCDINSEEPVARILDLLARYRPDSVITFAPDGLTGHPDHAAVSRWTSAAVGQYPGKTTLYYGVTLREQYDRYLRDMDEKFNVYFNIDQPHLVAEADCDILLKLSPDLCATKCAALAAMPSQTEAMLAEYGEQLKTIFGIEGFVRADRDIKWSKPKKD